jgi:hypothetical protein
MIQRQFALWLFILAFIVASCNSESDKKTTLNTLIAENPIHTIGSLAREPMVVEHSSGALFVAGYNNSSMSPQLWRSEDGGSSWKPVNVGTPEDGANGDSDVELAIGPDGTLYLIAMEFGPRIPEDSTSEWVGKHIAIGVSHDIGLNWSWTYLSQTTYDDRPWINVAPSGMAHAIWNDGKGVSHSISSDRGVTWVELERIHSKGLSSHLDIGPNGEIAVSIGSVSASGYQYDEGVQVIAVSSDSGQTWQKNTLPGTREWDPTFKDQTKIPRWVEPIAWDAEGVLYSLWSEGQDLYLARSRDKGKEWNSWVIANDNDRVFYPYLIAKEAGELACTWFSGRDDSLRAHVAYIKIPPGNDNAIPVVSESKPLLLDIWNGKSRSTGGEYIPVIFLKDGNLGVVTPVQNTPEDRLGFSWWKFKIH